jgi:hypothetical protein
MSDIYTADLTEQDAATAYNTVLWRLAVATGLAHFGDVKIEADPNEVLAEAERQIKGYWGFPE